MVVPIVMEVDQRPASLQQLERQSIPMYFTYYKLGKSIPDRQVQAHDANLGTHRRLMTAKGAHVVVASPTPNNLWETGTFSYTAPRFTGYCRTVVSSLGNLAAFVDHGQYVANQFKTLGATVVNSYYPNDHTHTSPAGANTIAGQFMKGLMCGGSALSAYSKNSTSSIAGNCI